MVTEGSETPTAARKISISKLTALRLADSLTGATLGGKNTQNTLWFAGILQLNHDHDTHFISPRLSGGLMRF